MILILLDAARADAFGVYGNPHSNTPGIDEIAKTSIIHERAYTVATFTYPSVGSLWTGVHLPFHGLVFQRQLLPPGLLTLPQLLQRHRITTAVFATNHFIMPRQGFARGVDHYEFLRWHASNPPSPFLVLKRVREWILKQHKPFFVYIHLMQPHHPYVTPPDCPSKPPERHPPFYLGWTPFIHAVTQGFIQPSPQQIQGMRFWYNANLKCADNAIYHFYSDLKQNGELDNRWFIITADHGEAFGEHGHFTHNRDVYEETIRVPLIIHPPRHAHKLARRYPGYVYMQDLHPSILQMFRIPIPAWVQFRPLQRIWSKPTAYGWKEQISCTGGYRVCQLRRLDWKLIIHQDSVSEGPHPLVELYHLPNERWFHDNRAPWEIPRVKTMIKLFRLWTLQGNLLPPSPLMNEHVAQIRALGYVAPDEYLEQFHIAPGHLGPQDFTSQLKYATWFLDSKTQQIGLMLWIQNLSRTVWPAYNLQHRGQVVVRIYDGKTFLGEGRALKDVYPGEIGLFHIIGLNELYRASSSQIRITLKQNQFQPEFDVLTRERGITPHPFIGFDENWSWEGVRSSDFFHWLTGTRGRMFIIRPPNGPKSVCIKGQWQAYGKPRQIRVMDMDESMKIWEGIVPVQKPSSFSFILRFEDTQYRRTLLFESLNGAERPVERHESPDSRLLSIRVIKPLIQKCSE